MAHRPKAHFAETPNNPSVSFGVYPSKSGRTVELRVAPGTNEIALIWDDENVDIFPADHADALIDLLLDAVAASRTKARGKEQETVQRTGKDQRRANMLKQLRKTRKWIILRERALRKALKK